MAIVVLGPRSWPPGGRGPLARRRVRGAALPPFPDLSALPRRGSRLVTRADGRRGRSPDSAVAVGELGRAYHASLLTDAAIDAYAQSRALDDAAWRWTLSPRRAARGARPRRRRPRGVPARSREQNPVHGLAWFRLGEMAFKDGGSMMPTRRIGAPAGAARAAVYLAGVTTRRVTPLAAYVQLGLARGWRSSAGCRRKPAATLDAVIARTPRSDRPARCAPVIEGPTGQGVPASARAYVPRVGPRRGCGGRHVGHARSAAEARCDGRPRR